MERKNKIIIVIVVVCVVAVGFGITPFLLVGAQWRDFTDSKDRVVTVPTHPIKIISMAPSITETLYALEVDDRVVGVTDYCNYPEEAKNKTSIGGFSTPNLEIIVSLEPDLIIAASYNEEKIDLLESMNLTIVIILAYTLDEIIDNIDVIGDLVDARAKAAEVTGALRTKMNSITAKTGTLSESEKIECYFEIWETPMVAGGGSFLDDMIEKAGGKNIFTNETLEWPVVSNEVVINSNPGVIFITAHSAPWYSMAVCDRTGYNVIDACKNNQIYICEDDIFLRTGPRIVDALENMTRYLYPTLLD